MGVIIKDENDEKSIIMGFHGFYELRTTVARIVNEKLGNLYHDWMLPYTKISDKEGNAILQAIENEGGFTENEYPIFDFLFAPDVGGRISSEVCQCIYEHIKNYDDDIAYGYYGRPDCAKFADFKEIIRLGAVNNCAVIWEG